MDFTFVFLLTLGFFAKGAPKWFDFILEHYILSIRMNKYWLLALISAILELAFDIKLILNEKSSLYVVQYPRSQAIWLVHIQPQGCTAFELILRILFLFKPSDLMGLFQII